MNRLNINNGKYSGETIDIIQVVTSCIQVAKKTGWEIEYIPFSSSPDQRFVAFKKQATSTTHPQKNIYISAGIHGDEPAGPLAVLKLLQENNLPNNLSFWIIPSLNPTGALLHQRENKDGIDLNRDYKDPKTAEAKAHIQWLDKQPQFDMSLCLHEDWESHGFYLYEVYHAGQSPVGKNIIKEVEKIFPIDMSEIIERMPAHGGIISPNTSTMPLDLPFWPEAFYLFNKKGAQNYTFETSSDFPLPMRVDAIITAVNTALHNFTI